MGITKERHTYDEWLKLGYRVKQGTFSTQRIFAGIPLFNFDQVTKIQTQGSQNPHDLHTFDEWNDLGYFIIKGEHSRFRDKNGNALFSLDQVEEKDF